MKVKVLLTLFVLVLVAASSGTAYYFYTKYQTAQATLDNPQAAAQTEVKLLTDKLGKLIALPEDEEPTVATVLEKDKIQDQPFFKSAENGDKVIIYTKAMKAILYRPSENKIIEVAPIEITQPEGNQGLEQTSPTQVTEEEPVIENIGTETEE
jgi:hypothetical protein